MISRFKMGYKISAKVEIISLYIRNFDNNVNNLKQALNDWIQPDSRSVKAKKRPDKGDFLLPDKSLKTAKNN